MMATWWIRYGSIRPWQPDGWSCGLYTVLVLSHHVRCDHRPIDPDDPCLLRIDRATIGQTLQAMRDQKRRRTLAYK